MNAPGRCLVDGIATDRVGADDRGLAYGDGVFETMRWRAGALPLWPRHRERLALGCERLRIAMPDLALCEREVALAAAGMDEAVVKLIVTRGGGARGYVAARGAAVTRVVRALPSPAVEESDYRDGVALRWCATPLGINPALAGVKHLNRLEQVMARAEWDDPAIAEGLCRDVEGRVVCATAANLFACIDGRWVTPAVTRCGVAGVMRGLILDRAAAAAIEVRDMLPAEIERATEVFLCNSVRGVLPVRRIAGCEYAIGAATRGWIAVAAALGLPPAATA
ncbi:MAG: aminodeoxychorismate lyase [Xanthomonadales bacterium]|nr:aminodeoxychorismate lyase [Xanthomonadales bacterium]